ncbi:uncharacterized protein C18orf19 homolog A [Scyliorhinus canicula]|uniref:uncharacterized protein C18orf19 homolog A n=1 Tax=Scyliorhinus canicula TaxID=7830 RepID=UPI0018F79E1B|nr:uncharacterized protein C18orf19 homolog A [Scyliorhinus canicula]XP_038664563.1 uncharacterized protein C18orf19 homolog A [Scyliorhinus canicula]
MPGHVPHSCSQLPVGKCLFLSHTGGNSLHMSRPVITSEHRRPNLQDEPLSTHQTGFGQEPKTLSESDQQHDPLSDSVQKTYFSSTKLNQEATLGKRIPSKNPSIGLFQRFKRTCKQYGKVLIPVHLLTSTMWFGAFYYAAMKGINVVPFLEYIGAPKGIIHILNHSQGGNALTAYALYKLVTPVRYTVTLGGTSFAVKYLRSRGYLPTPPPMRMYLQDRMEETRERFSEKMEETKELLSEKIQETKGLVSFRKKKE